MLAAGKQARNMAVSRNTPNLRSCQCTNLPDLLLKKGESWIGTGTSIRGMDWHVTARECAKSCGINSVNLFSQLQYWTWWLNSVLFWNVIVWNSGLKTNKQKNLCPYKLPFLLPFFFIRNLSCFYYQRSKVDFFLFTSLCGIISACSFGSVAELTEPAWVRRSIEESDTELSFV